MPQLKAQHRKDTREMSKNAHNDEEAKYLNTTNSSRRYNEYENFTVERDQNVSESFNYEQQVVENGGGDGCGSSSAISKNPERYDYDYVINGTLTLTSDKSNGAPRDLTPEHTYENLCYKLNGSKELLLHKFFRCSDRGNAIYANLCRGCGYGVFEAYGELCYFCASIVNGVVRGGTPASIGSLSAEHLNLANTSANVYENICENCFAIYDSDECYNCVAVLSATNEKRRENQKKTITEPSAANVWKDDELNSKTVKLGKSKSFNKKCTEKRSLFQGFFGSLKRSPSKPSKSGNSNSATRLEIVHNVNGFENVFRTQETFDLQRICELKRTKQTSSSDQHIYGRLKCTEVQISESNSASTQTLPLQLTTKSSKAESPISSGYLKTANSVTDSQCSLLNGDEHYIDFVETNCTTTGTGTTTTATATKVTQQTQTTKESISLKKLAVKAYKSGKRPRISKPRLLRRHRANENSIQESENLKAAAAQALYLPDSVCNWMTSLRREIHNYHSCFDGDDETVGLCDPKSIPAKNSLLTYYSKVRGNAVADIGDGCCAVVGANKDIPPKLLTNELTNNTNIACLKATSPIAVISNAKTNELHSEALLKKSDETSEKNCCNPAKNNTLREQQIDMNNIQHLTIDSNESDNPPVELAQIVNDFKRNLVAKKYKQQMSKDGNENFTCVVETAQLDQETSNRNSNNNSNNNNNNNDENNSIKENNIKSKVNGIEVEDKDRIRQELRARRKAIYLKVADEQNNNNNNNKINETHQNEKSNNNNNENAHNCNDVSVDYCLNNSNDVKTNNNSENASIELNAAAALLSELDSTDQTTAESPVSRRRTAEANVSSNSSTLNGNYRKRCGIYEPTFVDSVFVCDILNEFDRFLQHEEDAIAANESKGEKVECQQEYTSDVEEDQESNEPTISDASSLLTSALSESQITPYAAAEQQGQHNHHLEVEKGTYTGASPASIEHIFDLVKLNENLHLSRSLNNIIINYQQPLHAFLLSIRERYPRAYKHYTQARLLRKYWRFHAFCVRKSSVKKRGVGKCIKSCNESEKCDVNFEHNQIENVSKNMAATATTDALLHSSGNRNSVKIIVQQLEVQSSASNRPTTRPKSGSHNHRLDSSCATNETYMTNVDDGNHRVKNPEINLNGSVLCKAHRAAPKKPDPPQVPLRDPKTALSVRSNSNKTTPPLPLPIKRESLNNKMTIATTNSNGTQKNSSSSNSTNNANSDENIYQPIWKFKTVGEVQERYQTDVDYYEIGVGERSNKATTGFNAQSVDDGESSSLSAVLNSKDIEDHSEWETDDEFMFTTELSLCDKISMGAQSFAAEVNSINSSTALNSTQCSSSLSGSTVAGFSSSTATLASAISASLTHHLLRNIGIFYSLTEPKLRAIIYDYDRVHASVYFAKHNIPHQHQPTSISPCSHDSIESNANDSGIGKSLKEDRLPTPPPRTTSATTSGPANIPKKFSESMCQPAKVLLSEPLLPDSVQAWKFMLLDVNYLEDEEDMFVSETEILRSQEIKDDIDERQTQQLNILQRFKSASFGNLVDIPNEDDKKSIAERMRNKLQRGVFKLNVRSPKSDKKNRGIFRRAEATSLYLEDGMKPKYPIFGAPLDQLELDQCTHPNVPRFVVDSVAYIERYIQTEGLYRASGNKICIEELKQKLSESYIYDPKLLVIDDIHTLTSLLKLFFRELGAPLIPQEIYERLGPNLSDADGIETMREAFDEMREPNRSTLKFVIRHLTNVAACSSENRMPASNLAIVWGPCIMSANQIEFDIGRMNTLAKVLIENYSRIFNESERLVA